jgi:lysozyme
MIQGNDISAWQDAYETAGKVNFAKMALAGSRFCFMRAMFGLMTDHDFEDFWRDAKGKVARGAYYFPLTTSSIVDQTQQFCNMLKTDKGELPPVIDIERYKGTVPGGGQIETAINIIVDTLHIDPIIYTGYYMWRDEVTGSSNPIFAKYDLWIAAYSAKPMIPAPWTDWKFWQYTDKGPGLKYGVESLNIDMDWFNGDETEFAAYVNGVIPDPKPVESDGLRLYANCEMNIRTGPGISYSKVGKIAAGTVVTPLDVTGAEVWVKIDRGWVCKKQGSTIYLEAI